MLAHQVVPDFHCSLQHIASIPKKKKPAADSDLEHCKPMHMVYRLSLFAAMLILTRTASRGRLTCTDTPKPWYSDMKPSAVQTFLTQSIKPVNSRVVLLPTSAASLVLAKSRG